MANMPEAHGQRTVLPVCGHSFADPRLLQAALTHPSATGPADSRARLLYQRLEFLGDALWSFAVTDALVTLWPTASAGELTRRRARLVSATALAELAAATGVAARVVLSESEESKGARERPSVLSSAFEAVLGAIYLDGGAEQIHRLAWEACLNQLRHGETPDDPKTALQQLAQSRFKAAPRYRVTRRSGPPHAPIFEVEVRIGDAPIGRGRGRNRSEAERAAALAALADCASSTDSTRCSIPPPQGH
jgi:ribonuclease-3